MRDRAFLVVFLMAVSFMGCLPIHAQDWRQPNADQPNGYRASEAASHYHGRYHMPAQPLNGYHASEARSHYGGSRFEPSSGWDYQNNSGPGSAFTNDSSESGGPGSAFTNSSNESSLPGSAYSNASWYQNGGPQNSFSQRMCRANRWQMGYRNLAAAGYLPGGGNPDTAYGAQPATGFQSFGSRFQTFMPLVERESAWREHAIQNVESGRSGFNHIYAAN